MLIDTHCHLEKKEYENLDKSVQEILMSDVKAIVVSGYDVKSSIAAIELAHKHKNVYATVGFHPQDSGDIGEQDYTYFDQWLLDEKVVGVGEIGLDYHYDPIDKNKQKKMFKRQIEIAIKHNKPITVHNRDASKDIYDILKDYKVRGIIHCFNDTVDMAQKFINLGFSLGVGGIITFKKNNLKEVIKSISIEYIVLETDSPYLTPEPFRGRKNSPIHLPLIASAIADIKGLTYNEVASVTTANVKRLFDFKHDI
jgi:TatD DNase family protein